MYFNAFAFLFGIPIGIMSAAIIPRICAKTVGIKNYKSINKKKKKKHNKMVLLAKSKLNSIEVLIFKALIDSNISHDGFVLINNLLKQYDNMKKSKQINTRYQINEIVDKFLLVQYKSRAGMPLRQTGHIVLADHLQKTKKEYENLKK